MNSSALALSLKDPETMAAFLTIPDGIRQEVSLWDWLLGQVQPPITAALRRLAERQQVSFPTARRKYYAWKRSGWMGLLNSAVCPAEDREVTLPEAFVEYWRTLCERNQRKSKPAYRELRRRWTTGEAIPGMDPALPRTIIPKGWSYGNLMRYAPTRFELVAARVGRAAAADYRPLVLTTRAELYVGSHYLFDDIWHDHFVNLLDTKQTGRPLELHGLDLYSGCKFAWGITLRTTNADGTQEGLKEADMRFLLAHVLSSYGYDAERGTVLVVEHGTAAVRENMERMLHDLTGGKITVSRSGIVGDVQSFAGQYAGRGKGNFRFKAALESLGNLIHNEMAMLPGQVGMDVAHRPEGTHGVLKYNDALMRAIAELPPDKVAMLRWPVMTLQQFQGVAGEIYTRINNRTDHQLEGWDNMCVPCQVGMDGQIMMRRLAPAEVFHVGRRQLRQLPPEAVALMLGSDLGVERTVSERHTISFIDRTLGSSPLHFLAHNLAPGEKYLCVHNPFAPDRLFCFTARGSLASVCQRQQVVSKADVEALHRACGKAAKIESELLLPVARRGAALTRARLEMHRHNAGVIGPEPAAKLPRITTEETFESLENDADPPMDRIETSMPENPLDALDD